MALGGECWWITGASSGIGAALAVAAAGQGARLILSGRNYAALETVAAQCGAERCLILPFETTDYDAIPDSVARATAWAGRIDCLVNNAGISQRSLAVETSFEVYQRIIAVDLLAPIALTQALLPHIVAAGGGGRFIAISSVAGIVGAPMRTAYSAAKHGIFGYFDSLRVETAHLGTSVHVVAPGSVKTDVSRNALLADGARRGESDAAIEAGPPPSETATAILDAVARGEREIILATGFEAHIATLRRQDPDALFDVMAKTFQNGYAAQMGDTEY
jgi:dehydrogenase/reductase SDR family member 7B